MEALMRSRLLSKLAFEMLFSFFPTLLTSTAFSARKTGTNTSLLEKDLHGMLAVADAQQAVVVKAVNCSLFLTTYFQLQIA